MYPKKIEILLSDNDEGTIKVSGSVQTFRQ